MIWLLACSEEICFYGAPIACTGNLGFDLLGLRNLVSLELYFDVLCSSSHMSCWVAWQRLGIMFLTSELLAMSKLRWDLSRPAEIAV